jgi:DNA helicase HerA-like ATPase
MPFANHRHARVRRKDCLGLSLVSQRSSEVEATVMSQCISWILLRITNDADREHVRSSLPASMVGLTKMLSGLRRQEAIFVGQAATLPSRIIVRSLSAEQIPRSHDIDFDKCWQNAAMTSDQLKVIGNRWRYQQR